MNCPLAVSKGRFALVSQKARELSTLGSRRCSAVHANAVLADDNRSSSLVCNKRSIPSLNDHLPGAGRTPSLPPSQISRHTMQETAAADQCPNEARSYRPLDKEGHRSGFAALNFL